MSAQAYGIFVFTILGMWTQLWQQVLLSGSTTQKGLASLPLMQAAKICLRIFLLSTRAASNLYKKAKR